MLRLLEESILTQVVITILFSFTYVALIFTGRPVPDTLSQVLFVILGFYFGSKIESAKMRRVIYEQSRAALDAREAR